jgi:predicted enzyme related to lactoylglutathione lyase
MVETRVGDDYAHFALGDGLFELLQRSDKPQYGKKGVQVGFAVTDIEAARRELVAAGVSQISEMEGDLGDRWCYFVDPEGNVFELKEFPERR